MGQGECLLIIHTLLNRREQEEINVIRIPHYVIKFIYRRRKTKLCMSAIMCNNYNCVRIVAKLRLNDCNSVILSPCMSPVCGINVVIGIDIEESVNGIIIHSPCQNAG